MNDISIKTKFWCVKAMLILFALMFLGTGEANATPTIEWTPSEITGTVKTGESRTLSVNFVVNKSVDGGIRFRVVPSLLEHVQVSPSSFDSLSAGETKTVEITFTAADDDSATTIEGVIQLRKRGVLARPLPVTLVIEEGPQPAILTVIGQVTFDNGAPVVGAEITAEVAGEETTGALQRVLQTPDPTTDYTSEVFKSDPQIIENKPLMFLQAAPVDSTTTDENGQFSVNIEAAVLPARVRAQLSYMQEGLPTIDQTAWATAVTEGIVDLGNIVVPNAANAEMFITYNSAATGDGSIIVDDLPPEVNRIFSQSYDPDLQPDAFPGDFTEMGSIPLNSAMFLWMEALDSAGNPVTDLSNAVTIRSKVPQSQWGDLEDIDFGTDRIEIPIYVFNETTGLWEQIGVGWLEDNVRTVLPEDAQPTILDGSFPRDIFATFVIDHFSWMNVDYPYIGPWTLSRTGLDSSKRNNDCFFKAANLAKTIALSPLGRNAYARVNNPGADLGQELADAQGPEIQNASLSGANAEYRGEGGGSKDLFLGDNLWANCDDPGLKKDTILCLVSAILHETAHWKDDVKKSGGDTPGEEGDQLERDIFGGIARCSGGIFKKDGQPVSDQTKDQWLDPSYWENASVSPTATLAQALQVESPIAITISAPSLGDLGSPIPVNVEIRNTSSDTVRIFTRFVFEDHPLRFDIVNISTGESIPFLGPELQVEVYDSDFYDLGPGEIISRTFDLTSDESGDKRYNLIQSGDYHVTAVYSPSYGLPETASNTVEISLNPGGSISGIITNSIGGIITGATVEASQNGIIIAAVVSGEGGNYLIPELPPGTYVLTARMPGFLNSTVDNVQISAGQNTRVDFSLSPLLSSGELRLVLTWGQSPTDLDSHLWLPPEYPYHLYYARSGNLIACPFAELDVDDTSSYGPETITISQRFNEGTYAYSVFNYSGYPDLTQSQARVQVYDSTGLIATFDVPTVGNGRWWNVLTINGATGQITEINQLSSTAEPYPDTSAGCLNQ